MTDRISTGMLRELSKYSNSPVIRELSVEVIRQREALGEIQRLASLVSNDLMGRVEASKVSAVMTCSEIARAALNHKETE